MTPQQQQVAHWMDTQHRTVRYAPVTKLTGVERLDVIDFLQTALTDFRTTLEVRGDDVFRTTRESSVIKPDIALASLTRLHAEVLAAFHALGLAAAANPALYELTNEAIPQGAGPASHEPDFAKVIAMTYQPTL